MVIELLLFVLGGMQLLNGWIVLGGGLVCAVIAIYAYRLHESERQREALCAQIGQMREQMQQMHRTMDQERRHAETKLEEERAASNRALLQLRQECEEYNRSFFSQIAHELRLPVSVAVGYAELLRDGAIDEEEEQREYLGKIAERLYFINELVGRRLSEGRDGESDIAAGLKKNTFDLVRFLECNLLDLRAAVQEKEIECQLVTLEQSLQVYADHVLLLHVLDNLMENSMKYMGRPGTVTFMLSRNEGDVLLIYQDDGCGMDSEQAAHIFENGFRGGNSKGQSGSGHGLHLVDIIISAHGGTCTAESAPGTGMRITLRLPICDAGKAAAS